MRVPAAAAAGRAAGLRGARRRARLTRAGSLPVHRPRRELLGPQLAGAPVLGGFLDVLVLPGPLGPLLDASGRHADPFVRLRKAVPGPMVAKPELSSPKRRAAVDRLRADREGHVLVLD